MSMPGVMGCRAPRAADAEGLSKLMALGGRPPVAVVEPTVAGDLLNCCGDERGPFGEKTAWAAEKGVETGGVPAAPWACEGVRP